MKTRVLLLAMLATAMALAWPDLTRPVVRSRDGEEHLAGQIIVELKPELRGRVQITTEDGIALFGIPALDQLNRKWKVSEIAPALRHPRPDPLAQKYGCDLQYLLEFSPEQDIAPVIADYSALAIIDYACPNGWMRLDEEPNDSLYSRQYHHVNLGAPFAWGVAKGRGRVINVALDDGVDWTHPDIYANVWINNAEDINHNGRFDTLPAPQGGDIDNIDQDGNGYTDDVIGFDMVGGDPNPMPDGTDTHGTHCQGITNAVTNNISGVAAPPWNCKSAIIRCGGGGGISIFAAIAGLYYGVPLNFWSFSMSFGSSSPYQPMADACQYAWDAGCVLFGSAGNDGGEIVRYPACYNGVENVAASRQNDMKASWSNYGPWVDVTAPGEAIFSTKTRVTGSYGPMDGTSMSCPLAAGVTCWIKCYDTTLSNASAIQILHDACDSMPDPLYLQGKLGAGRVSMANVVLPLYYCDLRLTGYRFRDPNGNGRPDPGETVALIVTYSNTAGWRNATGVSATLATTSADVNVIKSTATFPDIPAGSSGNCSADSFIIEIAANSPPRRIRFDLHVNATPDPAYPDANFTVICGEPRVLLVDDDAGQSYERYYTSALDSNGILYRTWTVQSSGSPSADTLRHYPVVIWFTGDDASNTLTTTDQANLASFFAAHGKLLLCGQSIAEDLATDGFLEEYLHTRFLDDSTGKPYLPGDPSDPITRGDTMVLAGGGGASNARSSDAIMPLDGAAGCARYRDYPDTGWAVIRYAGDYQLVFFACAFEAVDHSSRYLQRWTLIKRIFEWFGERIPGINEEPPALPDPRPYTISVVPSPFRNAATVQFIAPLTGSVELRLYSLNGRLVQTQTRRVVFGERAAFRIDGSQLPSGLYLVQLATPQGVYAQKAAVLR